ncbi:MAG TPA: transposase [Candidatus Nocardiopsis merdipullorum]|nr:transposase [Candidatus Nocardiopsis merdipullorum]
MVEACRNSDGATAKQQIDAVITDLHGDVRPALGEVITLGRILYRWAEDVLGHFVRPGPGNGPTEIVNGCFEHPSCTTLGFRDLTHHILRFLLDTGGSRRLSHPRM